jgi:hypothetical protein
VTGTKPAPSGGPPAAPGEDAAAPRRSIPRDMFRVDLRSLAAFRIALALVILWDLLLRARDLEAHYTDAGVLPRTALIDNFLSLRPYISVHILHGSLFFQCLLFIVAGVCALALLAGYRTGAAAIACWFLTCSLHARNPLIVHGGDDLLRVLLFWSMFVPLGGRWSIDRARATAVDCEADSVVSWGTAGLLLQLCCMYVFSGVLKSHPSWRREGTAVYLALSLDQFATPLGRALLPYHGLLIVLTFCTLALEMGGPFVALFSYGSARLRFAVVTAFVLFHLGLGLCIELGIFPAVCIAGWLAFLPGAFWNGLEARTGPALPARLRAVAAMIPARWRQYALSARSERLDRSERSNQCARPQRLLLSWEGNLLALFFLAYILLWNIRACDFDRFAVIFPQRLNGIGEAARVDQYWNLFAPYPSLEHGWYVLNARLRDGDQVDLLTGRPVTWARPALVSATYRNERWRKYLMNLSTGQYASYRPYYAQYLQRTWNESHSAAKQLAHLEITFVREMAVPPYGVSPQQRVRLWTQDWSM